MNLVQLKSELGINNFAVIEDVTTTYKMNKEGDTVLDKDGEPVVESTTPTGWASQFDGATRQRITFTPDAFKARLDPETTSYHVIKQQATSAKGTPYTKVLVKLQDNVINF